MPLKLCRCEKEKLNRVIDQMKTLSSTVDELREDVNSLKLRFLERSSDDESTPNYCENKRNEVGASTFRRLKKYFERNIPLISTQTGSCVKTKCKSFFAQSSVTPVSCSPHISPREPLTCRNVDTSRVTSQTSTSDVKKFVRWITKRPPIAKRSRNNVCKNSKKTATVSTSTRSLKKHCDRRSKKSRCSNECRALKSTWRCERRTHQRSIGTASSNLSSPLTRDCNAEEFAIYLATCARRLQSINVATRAKKSIAVEANDTPTSSSILTSNTSVNCPQHCKIIFAKTKRNCYERKISKRSTIRKSSKSAQCSPDQNVYVIPKLFRREIPRNTLFQDVAKNALCKDTIRQKELTSRETQTSSTYDENFKDICMNEGQKYRPAANAWLYDRSLTSLTSRSSTAISGASQGLKQLDAENVSQKRVVKGTEVTKNTGKIVSTKESEQNNPAETKTEAAAVNDFTKDRRKRTYVISKGISSLHDNATADHNFYGKTEYFSSKIKDCSLDNQIVTYTSCEKILMKPEVTSRAHQGYDFPRTLCQSALKQSGDEHRDTTVCNNRRRKKYLPKFPRWSRKKSETPSTSEKDVDPCCQ